MSETIKEKPRGMFGEIRGGTGGKGGGIIEGEVVEEMGKMRGREPRIITITTATMTVNTFFNLLV